MRQVIENERGELLRAKSVLGCLYAALLSSGCDEAADAAEVARRLLGDSVDRLDSVYIGPLLDRLGAVGQRRRRNRKTRASASMRS